MRGGRHPWRARPGPTTAVSAATGQGPLRRALLAGLRDAHAAAAARAAALRRLAGSRAVPPALGRLLGEVGGEAEERLRRLEYVFASLREHTGGGDPTAAADLVALAEACGGGAGVPPSGAALAHTLRRDAGRGAEEHEALRHLAQDAGLHRAAHLLGLTAQECRARVRALAAPAGAPAAAAGPRGLRGTVH